jgi:RNA polymerase sigma-70 factor (ECF subfamily)
MGEKHPQFEELLLPHLDGAYNVAYWLVQNDGVAQVIVEKACLQAMREFRKPREAHLRAWLLTIVLRITHRLLKERDLASKGVPFASGERPDAARAPTNPAGKVSPDARQKESGQSFFDILSRMPVEFREILILHELEGWSYQQLAAALGTTRDTVTTRLGVARRSLREALGDVRGGEVKGEK